MSESSSTDGGALMLVSKQSRVFSYHEIHSVLQGCEKTSARKPKLIREEVEGTSGHKSDEMKMLRPKLVNVHALKWIGDEGPNTRVYKAPLVAGLEDGIFEVE